MRRFILLLLLIVISNNIKAQEIRYSLTKLDTCTNEVSPLMTFGIFKDDPTLENDTFITVKAHIDNNDSILFYAILPDTGIYYLAYGTDNGKPDKNQAREIYISDFGAVNDTLIVKYIRQIVHYLAHPLIVEYYCCTEKCDGYQVSHYENGHEKLEGYFKNGQPKGEMREYYHTGILKKKYIYARKYRKYEYYDPSGKMYKSATEERLRNASELWAWKDQTTYNTEGKIIKKVVYDATNMIEEYQFDELGNKVYEVKNNERTDFYPNGTIKAEYNWRIRRIDFDCWKKLFIWRRDCFCCEDAIDYTISYKGYHSDGTLKHRGKFIIWSVDKYFRASSIDQFDWLIYLKTYDNNKVIIEHRNKSIDKLLEEKSPSLTNLVVNEPLVHEA